MGFSLAGALWNTRYGSSKAAIAMLELEHRYFQLLSFQDVLHQCAELQGPA